MPFAVIGHANWPRTCSQGREKTEKSMKNRIQLWLMRRRLRAGFISARADTDTPDQAAARAAFELKIYELDHPQAQPPTDTNSTASAQPASSTTNVTAAASMPAATPQTVSAPTTPTTPAAASTDAVPAATAPAEATATTAPSVEAPVATTPATAPVAEVSSASASTNEISTATNSGPSGNETGFHRHS